MKTSRRLPSCLLATALLAFSCSDKKPTPAHDESGHDHGADQAPHRDEGEAARGHDALVTLTPEAARAAQVSLATAQVKPLVSGLSVPARITFTQGGVAKVASRVPGRLDSVAVALGQKVKRGQVLGYLDSPELGQARADYLSAATKARVAESNFKREEELLAKGITSEREMREAESAFVTAQAERNAADGRLHALGLSDEEIALLRGNDHYSSRFPAISPLNGTVVEIQGTLGQAVEATTPLFTVADLTQLWAMLDLAESQLSRVQTGQRVALTVQALPGQRFEGEVGYIGDIVDEKTRTIPVRVVVDNTDRRLKPGMFAQATIATGAEAPGANSRVVIPRQAVQQVQGEQVVFVPLSETRFRPRDVRTGASSASEVEILSGLEPGESYVSQGAFILKSELSKESMGEGHSH
ncbi:efflux RND transporter periplasmic adaptor subunit [Corallococcus macrosporus]|uniref:Heavy metal efflux pump, CzcB family protein n=1 Tax=Myxococcus fulvus (strain ATCC BAA-855 / HW-1) TaxID=483219 RepID=F8CC30_MYXFH|nr:efflux RND transporter periplasmic adaptor subunit [Corallococcus macrosporus]AEI67187.1 Heavy metal efflux pump, CzcB family protein [Corallococcus macrosporus]